MNLKVVSSGRPTVCPTGLREIPDIIDFDIVRNITSEWQFQVSINEWCQPTELMNFFFSIFLIRLLEKNLKKKEINFNVLVTAELNFKVACSNFVNQHYFLQKKKRIVSFCCLLSAFRLAIPHHPCCVHCFYTWVMGSTVYCVSKKLMAILFTREVISRNLLRQSWQNNYFLKFSLLKTSRAWGMNSSLMFLYANTVPTWPLQLLFFSHILLQFKYFNLLLWYKRILKSKNNPTQSYSHKHFEKTKS